MKGLPEDEHSLSNQEFNELVDSSYGDGAGNIMSIEPVANDGGTAPPIGESDPLPSPPRHFRQPEVPPSRPSPPINQDDELHRLLANVPQPESPPSRVAPPISQDDELPSLLRHQPRPESPPSRPAPPINQDNELHFSLSPLDDRKDSAATSPLRAPDRTRLYAFFEQRVAFNPDNKILLGQLVCADDKQTRYEFMLILVHHDNDQRLLRSTARAQNGTKSVTTEILGFRLWKCVCEIEDHIGITPHDMFSACKAAAHFYHLPRDRATLKTPTERQKDDIKKMLASGQGARDCSGIETRKQNELSRTQTPRGLKQLQAGPAPPTAEDDSS